LISKLRTENYQLDEFLHAHAQYTNVSFKEKSLEFVTIENIGKLVALVASVIAVYKAFSELFSKKKEKLRADYEFAEKFIADEKWKTIHDYLLERGYWGLSGKQLEASVIRHFLQEKDPLGKLTDYTQGLRYLSANRDNNQQVKTVTFNDALNTESKRLWKYYRFSVGYFTFALLSLGPVIFLDELVTIGLAGLAALIAWVLSFGLLAYVNLDELWAFQAAKRIVKFEANKLSQLDATSGAAA